jgi:glycosyl transferase family 87
MAELIARAEGDGGQVLVGRRLAVWAVGLALIGLAPVLGAFTNGFHDWPAFWSAGATVGTPDLVDPVRHLAWQRDHDVPQAFFAYPPGTAWWFAPVSILPLGIGFIVNGLVMLVLAARAGIVLGRTIGLDDRVAALATLAFAPVTASVVLGQNGPLGLLLVAIAIAGLVADRRVVTGVAIGLLLYKPTYAAPLLGLLVLRRRWTELGIAAVVAAGWFAVSAVAADDWAWPGPWLDGLRGYLADDFAGNADKAVSLPGLIARLPVPGWVAILAGVGLVATAIPRLVRAPILEAAVGACLIGVAVSPHAWGYDAALAVPFLLWFASGRGPWSTTTRRRVLVASYLLGFTWLVSRQTVVSGVAFVVLGLVVLWLVGSRREWSPATVPSAAVQS